MVTLDGAWRDYGNFAGRPVDFTLWQADYLDKLPADAVVVMLACHV